MKKLPEKFFQYADHHISPFEGGRGDVNNQGVMKEFINTNKLFDR